MDKYLSWTCSTYGGNAYENLMSAATRRAANLAANKGQDRKDLYTDNWDGSEYKGSPFNILNIILVVSVLTPLAGIIFAYFTYGKLWG